MKEENNQICILTAMAILLCAVLIGYNVFFAPSLPLINEVHSDLTMSNLQESTSSGLEKVNLNTASIKQLCTLKGIGKTTAQSIITYREANGGFQSLEELMEVDGIGEKTFAEIQNQIMIE